MEDKKVLWEKCAAFHGHVCPGLTIGYRAALYAAELLELTFSADEQVVCVSENDACGCDAIQVILGCSIGKGNLLFHMTGKQAFNFFDRQSGKGVRLLLRATPGLSRQERESWLMHGDFHEMFDVGPARAALPETARIFKTCTCAKCGERMAESHAHLQNGEIVCDDCFAPYTRGL